MDAEQIIKENGGFGRYQKIQFLMFCILMAGSSAQIYMTIFALYTPPFRCAVPSLKKDSYSNPPPGINLSIPLEKRLNGVLEYSRCDVFETSIPKEGHVAHLAPHKKVPCKQWVYDQSIMRKTVTMEMNLVCGRHPIKSNLGMAPLAGMLLGAFTFGFMADRKGRKTSLGIALIMYLISSFILLASTEPNFFGIIRVVTAASCIGLMNISFVLTTEMVTLDMRAHLGICQWISFVVGKFLLIPLAYGTKEWRLHCLSLSLIFLPCLSFFLFLEESPRWLISVGKTEEAKEIFDRMADENKVPLSKMEMKEDNEEKKEKKKKIQNGGLKDLFKSKILLLRCLVIFFNWFVINMMYYGSMFIADKFSSNLYISVLLSSSVEICAYFLLLLIKNKIGRKLLYASSTILAGSAYFISAMITIFFHEIVWLKQVLALIGNFGISSSFALNFVYTVELFPTVFRSAVLGMSSSCGKLSNIIVPYIVLAGKLLGSKIGHALPLLVFGIFGLVAGLLALTLPETSGKKLPETIEEGENLGRKNPDDEK